LVLGLAAVTLAAQSVPASKGGGSTIAVRDEGAIVGPEGDFFNMPTDVAVGRNGSLYVLDGVNHRVVVYDAAGRFQFPFGSRGGGPGQFLYPLGIAADPNGNVYVADSGNHRFQIFTAEGKLLDAVPLPATASGLPPDPADVAVDPMRKRLYIADNDNHSIHVYSLAGRRFEPAWGSPGQDQRQFRFPFLIDVSAQGYLLVVEPINTRIQFLNPEGKFVGFIGGWGIDPGQLFRPKGVAVCGDRVFITDSYLGNIQAFDLSGRFLGALADTTGTPMEFATPTGIAVDASRNRLYVVELKANRVRRLALEIGTGKPPAEARPLAPVGLSGPFPKPSLKSPPVSGKDALPNPSRECALCHVRWVQAFGRSEPPEGAMRDVMERQAGSGEMCLSCHDGSVVDSRFKVWSTRHHTTDAVPSPAVHIPTETFPLDAQGRMTCATCHTAHAVAGDSDLRTVIFLRRPNVDSSLCLSCHPEHAQKSERHHPLGRRDSPIPQVILDAGGKTSADGHTVLCQTCHEPHGARNAWMLVLPPSELCIACHADKAPEASPRAGAPVHRIGHTYAGFKPPKTLLNEKATFGPNGELSCLSCHRLHDASGVRPLLIRKNEDSSLCLGCHEEEKAVLGSPHDLRSSSPQTVNAHGQNASASGPCGACHRIHGWAREVPETNRPHSSGCMECHKTGGPGSNHRLYAEAHPVGVPVPQDMAPPLPLDSASRAIGCLTCHDPHIPRPPETPAAKPEDRSRRAEDGQRTPAPSSALGPLSSDFLFLRRPGSELCVLCHDKVADSLQGPHDPARFTPSLRETLGVLPSTGSCRVCHTTHSAQGPHLWARTPLDSAAGPISNLCRACHNGDSVKKPQDTHHPLSVSDFGLKKAGDANPQSAIRNPQSVEVSCTSCHNPHQGASVRDPPESPCLTCHEDKQRIKGSVHDPGANEWAKNLGFVSKDLCLDCHPIHAPKNTGGIRESLGGARSSVDLCEACHRSGAPGPAVQTPHVGKAILNDPVRSVPVWGERPRSPQDVVRGRTTYEETPHGVTTNGGDKRIQCTTCHDIHQNGQDSKLLRAQRRDSTLCLACHSDLGRLINTPHDLTRFVPEARNARGEPAAESGSCGVCHSVHPTSADSGTWAQRPPARSVPVRASEGTPHGVTTSGGNSLCTCCHRQGGCAEGRVPGYVDHPEVALLNRLSPAHPDYMPTFDDRGRPSPTGAISCPTCHQVHASPPTPTPEGELPPSYPMLLRKAHQTLCADCHGIEAPWRFLYYHRANRNPQRRNAPNAPAVDGKNEQPSRGQGNQ
jgi:predicted CXXCH cytochrome family protein